MPGMSDTIHNQRQLILQMARHIRNTDELGPLAHGRQGMDFLEEVMELYPDDYNTMVKGLPKAPPKLKRISTKKESVYVHTKERVAKENTEEGKYVNDKKPWTPYQLDDLLEHFLTDELFMIGSKTRPSLVQMTGRPVKAIQKALWRLGVRDITRARFGNYQPQPTRPVHPKGNLSNRQLFMVMLAFSPTGRKNAANKPTWLAKILSRPIAAIQDDLSDIFIDAVKNNLRWRGIRYNEMNPTHLDIMFAYLKKKQAANRQAFGDV